MKLYMDGSKHCHLLMTVDKKQTTVARPVTGVGSKGVALFFMLHLINLSKTSFLLFIKGPLEMQ